jgi:predicted ABC-class ATPase
MTGTESQIEWAERIKASVQSEFDRVASALRLAAERQRGQDRLDTLAIVAILEEKRAETLANPHAGYFVRVWRELSDQVRQLLAQDARYQAIQIERRARRTGAVHAF